MPRVLFVFFVFFSCYCNALLAHLAPTLIDIKITGIETPLLEISQVELQQGEPYLLVIENTNPVSLSLHFEKFGQAVFTQNLQGSPSVSQEALTLLPNTKVIWQLVTQEAGEFIFSLNSNQSMQTGNKIKLAIKSPAPIPEPVVTEEVTVEAKKESDEVKKPEEPESKPKRKAGNKKFLG